MGNTTKDFLQPHIRGYTWQSQEVQHISSHLYFHQLEQQSTLLAIPYSYDDCFLNAITDISLILRDIVDLETRIVPIFLTLSSPSVQLAASLMQGKIKFSAVVWFLPD